MISGISQNVGNYNLFKSRKFNEKVKEFSHSINRLDLWYRDNVDFYALSMNSLRWFIGDWVASLYFKLTNNRGIDEQFTEDEEMEIMGNEGFTELDNKNSTFKYILLLKNHKTNELVKFIINLKYEGLYNLGMWNNFKLSNMIVYRNFNSSNDIKKIKMNTSDILSGSGKLNSSKKVSLSQLINKLSEVCKLLL